MAASIMDAVMVDAVMVSGLGRRSGSDARDMLSGETVVGGVELRDAEFDDDMSSVGVLLEKLDPHSSESISAMAIVGVACMVAAIIATAKVC
jgi:NADPH-dependent curcumin reductase CurA